MARGAAPWPVQRAGDPKPACRQVDIPPAQREQLALAHTRGHGEDVEGLQAIVSDRVQQRPDLARVEGPHLVVGAPRWLHQRSRVAGDEPPARCLTERLVEDFVQMADGGRAQAGVHAVEVEPLDVGRLQLGEPATADERKDVEAQVALVRAPGLGSNRRL